MPEKIKGKSEDRAKLNFDQLLEFVAEKFPSCVIEKQVAETNEDTGAIEIRYKRAINWQALGTLVGEELSSGQCTVGRELFGFVWAGKNEAAREANRVIDLTLRPCPAESLDWDNTGNLYIEGDNLQALKMLQGSYLGKVKMIYIDPPYNTGNEFVYNDDFRQSQEDYVHETCEVDAESGNRLISKAFTLNADTSPRYHSKWCSMMYSRLLLARDLLRRDGVIFISIDDHEQHHLRYICDEVFGERNFLACFPRVTKKSGKSTDKVAKNHDYVLLYGKSEESQLLREVQDTSDFTLEDEYVAERGRYKLNQTLDYNSLSYNASLDYPIELDGKLFYPGGDVMLFKQRQTGVHAIKDWAWRWSKPKFEFGLNNGFVVVKNARIYTKTYEFATISQKPPYRVEISQRLRTPTSLDYTDNAYSNDNAKKGLKALFEGKSLFDYSKPLALVQSFVKMATTQTNNDVVLDFFSGSATTAEAVMRANAEDGGNRRFILVQLPEECKENTPASQAGYHNICEIGKDRIRRVAKSIASQLKCTKIVHGGGYESFRHI